MNFHRLVLRNLQRNGMQSLLTTLGILLGVSVWLFFAGLSTGIQENVLRHIVSERFVEVVPRSVQLAGVQRRGGLFGGSGSGLDTYTEEDLRAIEGVVATYPKQQLSFPATVRGGKSILGEDVWADLVADGIDPALVELSKDNPRNAFVDWAAIEDCTSDATCGDGAVCTAGTCERKACSEPSMCPESSYCDGATGRCEMPVPVIVSPSLLELYNGNIQSMLQGTSMRGKPPRLTEDAIIGFTVRASLGEGMLGRAISVQKGERSVREVPLKLVGFSPLAIPLGATVPRGYIERWNEEFAGVKSAQDYASIVVELARADQLNPVIDAVREKLNLDVHPRYEAARQAAGMLQTLLLVFGLFAAVIVGVGAMHIAQTAALRNQARRREFGVMRSVGASSRDILWMLIAEAAILGVLAGAAAFPLAWGAASLADVLFAQWAPDFPFKPDALFVFRWIWWPGSAGVAMLAAVIGASLPALRVSRMDPAEALRTHSSAG